VKSTEAGAWWPCAFTGKKKDAVRYEILLSKGKKRWRTFPSFSLLSSLYSSVDSLSRRQLPPLTQKVVGTSRKRIRNGTAIAAGKPRIAGGEQRCLLSISCPDLAADRRRAEARLQDEQGGRAFITAWVILVPRIDGGVATSTAILAWTGVTTACFSSASCCR
jgi:hypothetical protein